MFQAGVVSNGESQSSVMWLVGFINRKWQHYNLTGRWCTAIWETGFFLTASLPELYKGLEHLCVPIALHDVFALRAYRITDPDLVLLTLLRLVVRHIILALVQPVWSVDVKRLGGAVYSDEDRFCIRLVDGRRRIWRYSWERTLICRLLFCNNETDGKHTVWLYEQGLAVSPEHLKYFQHSSIAGRSCRITLFRRPTNIKFTHFPTGQCTSSGCTWVCWINGTSAIQCDAVASLFTRIRPDRASLDEQRS